MKGNAGRNWLDDDPEWQELRARVNNQPVPRVKKETKAEPEMPPKEAQKPSKAPKKMEVSLNLSLPKPKLPKLPKLSQKQLIISGAVAMVIGVGLLGTQLISSSKDKPADTKDVLGGVVQKPDFDTVLPNGKQEETSDNKIGYDSKRKVASFRDKIGNTDVVVSEQPLPQTFKANPEEEVKKLAEGYSANEVINESNPKAYLGTDVEGPQTAIFHKKGLLIFIQSARQIDKELWAAYITKLL